MQRKLKLFILLSSIFTSTILFGQNDVVLYNTGKIYVKGDAVNAAPSNAETKLYIGGSLKAARKVGTTGCDIKSEGGNIVLIGNLYHDAVGIIGNGGNTNDTLPKVFSRTTTPGKLEFRGTDTQEIKSTGTNYATIPSKGKSYIEFPAYVEINNQKSNNPEVIMDARVAAAAQNIVMTNGTFILDSDLANKSKDYSTSYTMPSTGDEVDVRTTYNTILAHLNITGNVTYPANLATSRFQVNFRMDQALDVVETNVQNLAGGLSTYKRMYGMGSPFESIKSDYFMFNTLAYLNNSGTVDATEVSPAETLEAGKGFTVGVDLRGSVQNDYDGRQPESDLAHFTHRNTDSYIFNRHKFTNGNNIHTSDPLAYTGEKLLAGSSPLTKVIKSGAYNALANPFMSPLSVKELVTASEGASVGNWGNVTVGSANTNDIYNMVWILSPNAKAYEYINNQGFIRFNYNYQYWTIKSTGGTYVPDIDHADEEFLISPMQLFMVYSYNATSIDIPRSAVKHGETKFIRSSKNDEEWKRYDDFVFEVIDTKTLTADRVCVVVRDDNTLRSANTNDTDWLNYKSQTVKTKEADNDGFQLRSESLPEQSLMSILYLEDRNGAALNEKIIPLSTNEEPLFLTPSMVPQTIYMQGLRMHTMDKIQEIWLVDKKEGVEKRLTADNYYETTIDPNDRDDRFVLRFSQERTGLDEIITGKKELTAYYTNDAVTVKTFTEEDFGSTITIYDVKGQVVNQIQVTDYTMNIDQQLANGLYIVKVSGKNPYATKILAR